jgi:hypothetical protein
MSAFASSGHNAAQRFGSFVDAARDVMAITKCLIGCRLSEPIHSGAESGVIIVWLHRAASATRRTTVHHPATTVHQPTEQ